MHRIYTPATETAPEMLRYEGRVTDVRRLIGAVVMFGAQARQHQSHGLVTRFTAEQHAEAETAMRHSVQYITDDVRPTDGPPSTAVPAIYENLVVAAARSALAAAEAREFESYRDGLSDPEIAHHDYSARDHVEAWEAIVDAIGPPQQPAFRVTRLP